MSTASIIAFLAFLSAFNVSPAVVKSVSDILYASQASSTAVTATTTLQVTPQGSATLSTQPANTQSIQPSFGAILTPVPQDKSAISVLKVEHNKSDSLLVDEWDLQVAVLDSNGNNIKQAEIHASWGTGNTTFHANGESGNNKADWSGSVAVPPTATQVTLTSGSLSTTISLGN